MTYTFISARVTQSFDRVHFQKRYKLDFPNSVGSCPSYQNLQSVADTSNKLMYIQVPMQHVNSIDIIQTADAQAGIEYTVHKSQRVQVHTDGIIYVNLPTPAQKHIEPYPVSLRKQCSIYQHVEVQPLNKNPHLTGIYGVHKKRHQQLTFPMLENTNTQQFQIRKYKRSLSTINYINCHWVALVALRSYINNVISNLMHSA